MTEQRKILVCDDEPHILRAAEFKFRRAGYDVTCASDGQQAWECIEASRPDAVITDCQMPRLNGIELAQRIHDDERTRGIPVLMLTAKGFELSQEKLRAECHIVEVLSKPFSPRELLERVDRLFDATEGALDEAGK
ncbi:MAG TPA: response regulator [Planctomycetaceae bacterium]|nr:response regulator [Planctomycetaceae bacterium]